MDKRDSTICFEMSFFVVEAICARCASFMILTANVSEICGGQTNAFILVVYVYRHYNCHYCTINNLKIVMSFIK